MTWFVHVNRNTINSDRANGTRTPAVRIQKGRRGKPTYAMRVRLPAGAEVLYSPHEPILPCGARLVIMTQEEPEIIE